MQKRIKARKLYRDGGGRFISKKSIVDKMRRAHFILKHVVNQEMILSYAYRIIRNPELLVSIKECRCLARRIAREIRQLRIEHGIYECF